MNTLIYIVFFGGLALVVLDILFNFLIRLGLDFPNPFFGYNFLIAMGCMPTAAIMYVLDGNPVAQVLVLIVAAVLLTLAILRLKGKV